MIIIIVVWSFVVLISLLTPMLKAVKKDFTDPIISNVPHVPQLNQLD